jgi:pimeloyl-ACP methyl ester carboxylesterase
MSIKVKCGFAALVACLTGVGTARAEDRVPGDLRFEPFVFKTGDGQEIAAELGRLVVPEQRARAGGQARGKTIELAFVRLKSTAAHPGPPLVVLAGGPGGSGITETRVFWNVFRPLLDLGDVIALEQRGTGKSSPYLMCPSITGFDGDDLVSRDRMLQLLRTQFGPCAADWRTKGVDVRAYNTRESADDIDDLRRALGANKLRLWGFSFGTQLGLMTIRRHGEHIDRAVLASVEGLDDTRKLPSVVDRHLAEIDRLVKADPAWSALVPDFLAMMRDVHARLDREPRVVEIVDRSTKAKRKVRVGGFALQVIVAIDAGNTKHVVRFPALYHAIANGDDSLLAQRVQALQDRMTAPIPWAMTFATDCASGATPARGRRIDQEAPQSILGTAVNFPWPEICELWENPDLGDALRAPVKSSVPVLFVSGSLDGRTPVANVQDIRRGFPNGVAFIVDNAGHEDVFELAATVQAVTNFFQGKSLAVTRAAHSPPKLAPPVRR